MTEKRRSYQVSILPVLSGQKANVDGVAVEVSPESFDFEEFWLFGWGAPNDDGGREMQHRLFMYQGGKIQYVKFLIRALSSFLGVFRGKLGTENDLAIILNKAFQSANIRLEVVRRRGSR